MEEIDLSEIRGHWQESEWVDIGNGHRGIRNIAGGDNTVESIKMVAEKVNEIIRFLQEQKNHEYRI